MFSWIITAIIAAIIVFLILKFIFKMVFTTIKLILLFAAIILIVYALSVLI
ncbi:hypothetical protein [Methanococcus maripaludis]|uniref:ABC-type multidrug transport system permease subunit n=1 Tax=Methanococcus maripaludis TaxID=39152 RepID=A0A7J9PH14_METMI|nr:hypothetical protein [Methanococcus maripaludis]MBA2862512.1 ABC-type multidrug transport system permease subunit [Methanococcus maripaludis]